MSEDKIWQFLYIFYFVLWLTFMFTLFQIYARRRLHLLEWFIVMGLGLTIFQAADFSRTHDWFRFYDSLVLIGILVFAVRHVKAIEKSEEVKEESDG